MNELSSLPMIDPRFEAEWESEERLQLASRFEGLPELYPVTPHNNSRIPEHDPRMCWIKPRILCPIPEFVL